MVETDLDRAMKGGRFHPPFTDTGPGSGVASFNNLRTMASHQRGARLKVERVFAQLRLDLRRLKGELDRGELGQVGYDRRVEGARDKARVDSDQAVAEAVARRDGIRRAYDHHCNEFAIYSGHPLSGMKDPHSGKGDFAAMLKALPDDARDAMVQTWIDDRAFGELGMVFLVFLDLRAEIQHSMRGQIPQFEDKRAAMASMERDTAILVKRYEGILKGDLSDPRALGPVGRRGGRPGRLPWRRQGARRGDGHRVGREVAPRKREGNQGAAADRGRDRPTRKLVREYVSGQIPTLWT